jgi:adenine phosphoribosyltransferase
MNLKDGIRTIADFPIKGIQFRDISPILQNPQYLTMAVDKLSELVADLEFDLVIGPESRGFIFGVPIAYNLKKGFVPVRKPGKLPYETIKKEYKLEYGTNTLEIHIDAIKKGQKVVIVDDLLATGGTCKAVVDLIEEAGGVVECILFLIELDDLKGIDLLKGYNVKSVLKY